VVTALPPPEPQAKRLNPLKLKQMQKRCAELEREIADAEASIATFEAELANFVSSDETVRVSSLLDRRRAELAKLLSEWEQVSEVVALHQA
jgi:septal ring factor EnvC (AmiA/AmiB activator)